MGLFDPKADRSETVKELARLAGENIVLRQAVVLLLRRSPLRDELLADLRQDTGVLTSSARTTGMHPRVATAMRETLEAIERMAQS